MYTKLQKLTGTFRFRLFAIVALCWLVPVLVLGSYLGGRIFHELRASTEALLIAQTERAQASAVQAIERLIKLSKDATYDMELYNAARGYETGELDLQEFLRQGRAYLNRKYAREPLFHYALFLLLDDPSQLTYSSALDMPRLEAFQHDAQQRILEISESLDTSSRFVRLGEETYLVRNLLSPRLKRFGILVLGVDAGRLLAPLTEGEEFWQNNIVVWLDGQIVGPGMLPSLGELPTGLSEQGNALYYQGSVRSPDYRLFYLATMSRRVVYAQIYQFYGLMQALVLLLLPVEGLLMFFVHRRLTKPLFELTEASRSMALDGLGITVEPRGGDEIGALTEAYNAMSLRIQHLIEKSFQEELALRDARIEALQSRINPHFLNNALEMINWQARMEGNDAISGMIDALSTLLNAGMDRAEQRVAPLREELRVADAYCYFLDQRFGDRVKVERDVAEGLLSIPVPRLVIQTLLENAVEHGIAPAGSGRIQLRIYRRDGFLFIEVTNNGKGLSAEDQSRIAKLLEDDGTLHSERLGIRNISRRLKLIYGPAAGLTLESDAQGDTMARMRIPLDESHYASHKEDLF